MLKLPANAITDAMPVELAENLAAYRSSAAVANLSHYCLHPEEEAIVAQYYKPGQSVLDLACGMGRTTLLLHEMGMKVRGVDRSEVLVELAKRRLPYLDLQQGSYAEINEPDNSFDHVLISLNGIDYAFPVEQRMQAMRECARVVKPGGTFIFCSHNLKSLHLFSPHYGNKKRWKLKNCLRAFKEWDYIHEEGLHTYYAPPKVILQQIASVGLQLVEMRWHPWPGDRPQDRYFSPYIYYICSKAGQ